MSLTSLSQHPPIQSVVTDVCRSNEEESKSCFSAFCALIQRIYQIVSSFFEHLFCCQPNTQNLPQIDSSTYLSNQPPLLQQSVPVPSFVPRPPSPTLSPQNAPSATLPASDAEPSQDSDMIFGDDDSLEANASPPIAQTQEARLALHNQIASAPPIHSIPAVVSPSVDAAQRTNQAAMEAIQRIATLYSDRLATISAEDFIAQHYKTFIKDPDQRQLSTLEILAGPYTRTLFCPMNMDMRYGEITRKCHDMFKSSLHSPWVELASEPRKIHVALLQEGIKNSSDRVPEHKSVVYRVTECPNDFIGLLAPENIQKGIFVVNRSFLSTSPDEDSFDPATTGFASTNYTKTTLLKMSIRLGLETAVLDLNKRGLSYKNETEILLLAGLTFQVEDYKPDSKHLFLKEVPPSSINGELYTTVL